MSTPPVVPGNLPRLAWDGQTSIFENGVLLAEGERFRQDGNITVADVDLDLLRQERVAMGTFHDNRSNSREGTSYRNVQFSVLPPNDDIGFDRTVERFPFVPSDESRLQQDCYEAYNIQVAGLVQRLRAIGSKRVVIGVSGGLDSTHALIVAAKAMDLLRLPRANILAYTMPGFATGAQSKRQAWALMQALEVSSRELDIRPAATQMLKDMGHPFGQGEPVYDITFENVQAGLRTDYLFRLANHHGGLVIGAIGPYALQDFSLFYTLRFGFRPSKIAFLAMHAWKENSPADWPVGLPAEQRYHYELADIRKWLEVFLRRFFAFSQFKRSAMPNGPKVSAGGSLSPRGDWRAPSDGNASAWLEDLERNVPH